MDILAVESIDYFYIITNEPNYPKYRRSLSGNMEVFENGKWELVNNLEIETAFQDWKNKRRN